MGAVRAALIVLAVLAFFYAMPAASSPSRAPGREMVAQYELPPETVARYAALADAARAARAAGAADATRERANGFDDLPWIGPQQAAGVGRNPYTLVLTVTGVAKAAGDIRTQWQAGWEVRESPVATREVLMSLGNSSTSKVAAGTPVTLTAIGAPVTFRGERQVAPLLNLIGAHNLEISDVRLQVWSGSAPMVAWPAVATPRPALLAAGALCLLAWFFLARRPRPASAPEAVRVPQLDLPSLLEHAPSTSPVVAPVAAPPAATPQNQAARVVSALRDVLTMGLAVPTEYDPSRRRRG